MRAVIIAAVLACPACAFVHQQQLVQRPSFVAALHSSSDNDSTVVNRRDALGLAAWMSFGAALTAVASPASAASNPALETFKGKAKANSFYPGKGMRLRDQDLLASNPALETFKGRKRTKGSFQPGKGIRQRDYDHHDDNVLMAASNPALETFKGKAKANSFYPGKGMRLHEENLLASNPALETFKGRKRTKGSFQPGKGIRQRLDNDKDSMFMMAASNPALETFKGKAKANSFYPGKGMRLRAGSDNDELSLA